MFFGPTSATVNVINNHVLDVLLATQIPFMVVTNGLHSQYDCH